MHDMPRPPVAVLTLFITLFLPACSFLIEYGRPNLGLAWYLFLEMFDHFRPLFAFLFLLMPFVHLPALSLKLAHRHPKALLVATWLLLAIHKPYPNLADYGLWTSSVWMLGPDFVSIFPRGCAAYAVEGAFYFGYYAGAVWTRWMHYGSSNANFYFAVSIGWNLMQSMLLIYGVWLLSKWSVKKEVGGEFVETGELHQE